MLTVFPLLFLAIFAMCDEDVRYSAVIYRHGDRTPVQPYPNDPWKNESNWPVKFGELTNEGKRQHFALGQWLRKRYAHLLSVNFDPVEIFVRSTDVDRTLMSAQVNLAGMYPPKGEGVWDKQLFWQPIPVHTVPQHDDEVLAMLKDCTAYNIEYARVKRTTEFKEKLKSFEDLMNYISNHSGMKVKNYDDIENIYSTLYIENHYNFSLPNWTHTIYPNTIREPACYSFVTPTMSPTLARLKAGPLLREVFTSMMHIIANETMSANHTIGANQTLRRVSIYSGHDYSVANILNSLGVFDNNCPPYTATILMELLKVEGKYVIRVSYRNSTEIVEPRVLSLPDCGKLCPVEKFKELYRNLLNVNWNYECNDQFSPLLGVSFFVGLALILTMYLLHKIQGSRSSHNDGANYGYSYFSSPTLSRGTCDKY